MIVFSDALVATLQSDADANLPLILYDSLVTISTVTADQEDADYPATNLANPATNQVWKSGSTADQYLTVDLATTDPIDCVGIARHNLGSGGVLVSIEGITAEPGAVWEELVGEQLLATDAPALFVFEDAYLVGVRVKLQPDSTEPQAAVLMVGKSLRVEKKVQPGHTPLPYSRQRQFVQGSAQSGDFLGEIELRSKLGTSVSFRTLSATWYRETMAAFVDACRSPFFFAWRPAACPDEVGYARCASDPQPTWSYLSPDYVDVTLSMEGLSL